MGVFDHVLGKKEEGPVAINLNQREAFAAVCVLAIASDGTIEDEEVRRIVTALSEKKMFRGTRINELGDMLNTSVKLVQRHGQAPVIEATRKALPTELRETAFALSTDLLLADGEVHAKEKAFLEEFQKALGIDDATALKVAEVMVIKNRG